ncbi:hypothetical protein DEIPH_ctg052orf0056 [Deinococcus phoenicis]|uniref:Uncharacterized protein n=1 Tax=Deinococcus phoenicis TaxID=1476583 RepID=A0A016QM04_9DEIO|nr:hypothetical protein [Deinococcus phoenicis]EYB67058.1 hypothetical protein DEIPH_ctg052orf0056 [Deinococcus phoenicis]
MKRPPVRKLGGGGPRYPARMTDAHPADRPRILVANDSRTVLRAA